MFINPYNFISLSEEPERSEENNWRSEKAKKEDLLTGVIDYTLTTCSRLHIPNTSTDKAFAYCPVEEDDKEKEHKRYDFYSYHMLKNEEPDATGLKPGTVSGKNAETYAPVIPGSEVRGMIRTLYETLTNSCLPVIDGETRIGKRTVEQFEPGVLVRDREGRVSLYSANDSIFRNHEDFSEKKFLSDELKDIQDGSFVYFRRRNRNSGKSIVDEVPKKKSDVTNNRGYIGGYLLKGELGPEMPPNGKSPCDRCVNHRRGAENYCAGKQDNREQHCYLKEKHCAHLFEKKEIVCRTIDAVTLDELKLVISQYQNNAKTAPGDRKSQYTEYELSYEAFRKGDSDGLPVYYSKLYNERYVLSPACITREVYRYTEKDIVGEYIKCGSKKKTGEKNDKDKVKMCAACSLFGTVSDEVNQGSRIRFSDLQLDSDKHPDYRACYDEDLLTLDELSVPKISTTEFYLQRPKPSGDEVDVWFWTYDYYVARLRNGDNMVKSYHPMISGRKFYWHNRSGVKNAEKKNKRNRTVRTVKSDIEFTGKLYFDGITEKQLQQLLYVLNYTSDNLHGYKLGTGKPLGLGSVKMHADSVQLRKFKNGAYQYESYSVEGTTYEKAGFDLKVKRAFELITRYLEKEEEENIKYPQVSNQADEEGFKWFVQNRNAYKIVNGRVDESQRDLYPKKRKQVKIQKTLPDIMDRDDAPVMGENDTNHTGTGERGNPSENHRRNLAGNYHRNQTQGTRNHSSVQYERGNNSDSTQKNQVKPFTAGKKYKAKITKVIKGKKGYTIALNLKGDDGRNYTSYSVVSKNALSIGKEVTVTANERNREFSFVLAD